MDRPESNKTYSLLGIAQGKNWKESEVMTPAQLRRRFAAKDSGNVVFKYCEACKASNMTPQAFARFALVHERDNCLHILECIGSWPSSEPELRALQTEFR